MRYSKIRAEIHGWQRQLRAWADDEPSPTIKRELLFCATRVEQTSLWVDRKIQGEIKALSMSAQDANEVRV